MARRRITPVALTHYGVNFSKPAPVDDGQGAKVGVRLFPDDNRPRRFVECNLVNCEPPPGSEVVRCNTTLRGVETIRADEVVIDGFVIPIDQRASLTYGRLNPDTLEYDYLPTPRVEPIDDEGD